MINILANDGISNSGIDALKKSGFNIITTNVAQEQLENYINKENISVILVRSATTVRKDLIDNCPGIKIIGRGGVGMDNIDVEYARSKNIHVINTPAASSAPIFFNSNWYPYTFLSTSASKELGKGSVYSICVFFWSNKFFRRTAKMGMVLEEKLMTLFGFNPLRCAMAHSNMQDKG